MCLRAFFHLEEQKCQMPYLFMFLSDVPTHAKPMRVINKPSIIEFLATWYNMSMCLQDANINRLSVVQCNNSIWLE